MRLSFMFNFLFNSIFVDWKTTVVGLITTIAGFIAMHPQYFGGADSLIVAVAIYVNAGGAMGLGIYAQDKLKSL